MEKRDHIAVILAGGQSRRFGSDKAFAKIKGKTGLGILADSLQSCGFEIFISTNHPQHAAFGPPLLFDEQPFEGPLVALHSIFSKLPAAEKILLTACDMPFLNQPLSELLWKEGEKSALTLLASEEGPSPLPGIYSHSLFSAIQKNIASGERSLQSLLNVDQPIKILESEIWSSVDPKQQVFRNINKLQDLTDTDTLTEQEKRLF